MAGEIVAAHKKPIIAIDGRYGLRAPRRGVGEYVYHLLTELGFFSRPYELHVFGDLSADPEVLKRIRFLHPVDLLITPNFFTWEQMAFPQASHGASFLHGTANIGPLMTRIPQILTIHDVIEWHRGQDFEGRIPLRHHLSRLYRMNALKHAAPRAKAVLTVSEHAKRDIAATLHVDARRIAVTPLASKHAVIEPIFPKEKFFLTLGAMDPRKNLLGTIEAFKRAKLPGYTLKIVGLEPRAIPAMKSAIHAQGLDARVELESQVSDETLQRLYATTTAFLYFSFFEGFGLPVLEAMAAGAPVMASNTSSLPEVIGAGGLFVNPRNTLDMAQAMERVAQSPNLGPELAQKGHSRVQTFHWKKTAELTHHVYLEMLSQQHLV